MLKDIMDIPSFYEDENAAKAFFQENGFHAEYNYIDADQCDFLIKESAKLKNALNGEYRPALNPHTENENFLSIMKSERVLSIIQKLIGGKVSGLQTQFFFGRPGTKGFSIHQDNFFVEAQPASAFVSTWLALSDVTIENGTIFLYPGAHKQGTLPVRKLEKVVGMGQEYNANNEETVIPAHFQPVAVEVPRGTLIFLDSLVPHGSYDNNSKTQWRQVMLNNYISQGTPFRAGNSAKREEIKLD